MRVTRLETTLRKRFRRHLSYLYPMLSMFTVMKNYNKWRRCSLSKITTQPIFLLKCPSQMKYQMPWRTHSNNHSEGTLFSRLTIIIVSWTFFNRMQGLLLKRRNWIPLESRKSLISRIKVTLWHLRICWLKLQE